MEALGAAVVVGDGDAEIAAVLDRDAGEIRPDVALEPAVVAVRGERGHGCGEAGEERVSTVEAGQRHRSVAVAVTADRDLVRAMLRQQPQAAVEDAPRAGEDDARADSVGRVDGRLEL